MSELEEQFDSVDVAPLDVLTNKMDQVIEVTWQSAVNTTTYAMAQALIGMIDGGESLETIKASYVMIVAETENRVEPDVKRGIDEIITESYGK